MTVGEGDDLKILTSTSISTVIEKHVEQLIVSGELKPGDWVNELQLSKRFNVSRGPIREAARSLATKGFVEIVKNRGVFIRQLSLEEACEVYEIRGTLFGLAGRLLALRMTDRLLIEFNELLAKMKQAAEEGDFAAYYPVNLEFHFLIVRSSGNKALFREYERFVNSLHLFRTTSLSQGSNLSISNIEHSEIVSAMASGDADRAYMASWRHVERSKHRLIAAMRPSE